MIPELKIDDYSVDTGTHNEKLVHAKIHGISVPLDTPIIWMSRNLSFPDGFLHIVLVVDKV